MSFLNQLINGLHVGSIYALIALGYTMVYGIVKLINFAHGDIIMVGLHIVAAADRAGLAALHCNTCDYAVLRRFRYAYRVRCLPAPA